MNNQKELVIGILGLGYVGLPLAVSAADKYKVIGFDINLKRIEELQSGVDINGEVSFASKNLKFTADAAHLLGCNFYIVTAPTPTGLGNVPDLSSLKSAIITIGKCLKEEDIVVIESTVYPGVTEDVCAPLLEQCSGLKLNRDFFVGYSPERINPGDDIHSIASITKVTSGSTNEAAKAIDDFYKSIIPVGTFRAKSIKVAEAAKVIENTQRDVNIALINELAKVFKALNIDFKSILEAARTKWNFLDFRPGLVGGHCISVDPYYLAHAATTYGQHPEMILAGRRINDSMPEFIASEIVKYSVKQFGAPIANKVLILGCTFKENCPDQRNSKVFSLAKELLDYGAEVDVYDPIIKTLGTSLRGLSNVSNLNLPQYNVVVLAVKHDVFKDIETQLKILRSTQKILVFDLKHFFDEDVVDWYL